MSRRNISKKRFPETDSVYNSCHGRSGYFRHNRTNIPSFHRHLPRGVDYDIL